MTSPAPNTDITTRPRKKGELPTWVVVLVFVLFGLSVLLIWYLGNRPPNGLRLDAIQSDIRQNLPEGTPREKVDAWIAGHGFTNIRDTTDTGGRVNGMKVTIPNETWFDEADIVIHFTFDSDWKLQHSTPSRLFRN